MPAEYMETYYPMIVEEYSARTDSCGAGLFRGGCGIKKVYRFLADGTHHLPGRPRPHLPLRRGLRSKPGAPSKKTLLRASGEKVDLPSKISDVPVFAGDRLVFETAGAGGVGDPLERDPEAVAKDVRWSLISAAGAESSYGVIVGDAGAVDTAATETKREALRSGRGERPGFDHGDLPPLEEQRRVIAETRRKFNEWLSGELGAARDSAQR